MKKAFIVALCMALLLASVIPAGSLAATKSKTMYVYTANGGVLNMRRDMVTHAKNVVVKIPNRSKVTVISLVNKTWAKCKYDKYTGYCMRRYLVDKLPDKKKAPATTTPDTFTNAMFGGMKACYYKALVRPTHPTGFVNLRWAPSTAANVHSKYYANAELTVMAENANWCQVLDEKNNIMGFMRRSFLVTE